MMLNSPKSRFILVVVCLLVSGAAHGAGEGQGVEAREVSPALHDTEPGRIISLSFVVTNNSEQAEEFAENLTLPQNWQAIMPATTFTLRPAETTTRLQAFQVATNAAAGRYEVTYDIRSERDYAIQNIATVVVIVLPVTNLQLLMEEKPEAVIAGETYEVKLRLINQGNAELQVKLEATSEDNCPTTIEPAETTVGAGQSVVVVATVNTYKKERRPHPVVVRVTAQGMHDDKARAAMAISADLIPRITEEPDLYHRLPVQLQVRVTGEDAGSGLQAELSGSGTLDEAGTKAVDFLLRTPDVQSHGSLGGRDENYLNYHTDDLDVRLGDQSYALSRLTSYHRYGRGLGVDVRQPGDTTRFGGYYLQGRWDRPDREEAGLYVSHQFGDNAGAQVNFLRKQQDALDTLPAVESTMWSVETRLQPTPNMNVQAEYGRSDSNRNGGVSDNAYRVEGDGRLGHQGYWRLSKIHAGPDYSGYYHDSDYTHGTVTLPLTRHMQGHLSYGRWESNLALRSADNSTANREKLWQVGVSQSLPNNWYLTLDYDDFEHRDALLPADFDFSENAWQLGIGHSANDYSFRVDMRMGDQHDRLTGESQRAYNCRLLASYRPRRDATFTLYGGFGDDRALEGSRLLRASSDVGASVAWKPTDNLDLNLWYSKYDFNSNDRSEMDRLSLQVGYELANGHAIEATARNTHSAVGGDRTSYLLAYTLTVPLSLPVSRKTSVGAIRGRVCDAQAPGQPGLAGVILRINAAIAVTDKEGRFVFPAVALGTYALNVDRGSLGAGRIVQQNLPMMVEVKAGQAAGIELAVIPAASVAGTVLVAPSNGNANGNGADHNGNGGFVVGEPGNNNARHEPTGLANVLVELVCGDEILRRATDQRGRFLFDTLRPGQWHLKVYGHNLPAYHYLETPEQDLTLTPAQTVDVTIQILPKTRQIKFIDEGVIRPNSNSH